MAGNLPFVADLVTTIKLFGGDLFGGVVRDVRVAGGLEYKNIDARIDSVHLKPFLTLLHAKYDVVPRFPRKRKNGVQFESYTINPKFEKPNFDPIELDVVAMTLKMFRVSFIDFDVNLFSENDVSLYLRWVPYTLKYVPDKLSFVKERIVAKTFSYLSGLSKERSHADICELIEKSVDMTRRGWTMDDYYGGGWVVGRWRGFLLAKHRRKLTREKYSKMLDSCDCAICHERFKPDDIVFNGACNHTFHWKCDLNSGLCTWIKDNEQSSCPYCRSNLFDYS